MAELYEKAYYDRIYTNDLLQAIQNNDYKFIEEAVNGEIPYRVKLILEAVKFNNIPILDLLLIGQSRMLAIIAVNTAINTHNLNIIKHILDNYELKNDKVSPKQPPGSTNEKSNLLTIIDFRGMIIKNPDLEIMDYIIDKLPNDEFRYGKLDDFLNDATRTNNIDLIKLLIKKFGRGNKFDPTDTLYYYLSDVDTLHIDKNIIELFIGYGANIMEVLIKLKNEYRSYVGTQFSGANIKNNICYIIDQLSFDFQYVSEIIILAAECNNIQRIDALIDKFPQLINMALDGAALSDNPQLVDYYLAKGANTLNNALYSYLINKPFTSYDFNQIKHMINRGADIKSITKFLQQQKLIKCNAIISILRVHGIIQ